MALKTDLGSAKVISRRSMALNLLGTMALTC